MRKWCCGLHQMQVLASQGADCCHRHPCHTPAAQHPHQGRRCRGYAAGALLQGRRCPNHAADATLQRVCCSGYAAMATLQWLCWRNCAAGATILRGTCDLCFSFGSPSHPSLFFCAALFRTPSLLLTPLFSPLRCGVYSSSAPHPNVFATRRPEQRRSTAGCRCLGGPKPRCQTRSGTNSSADTPRGKNTRPSNEVPPTATRCSENATRGPFLRRSTAGCRCLGGPKPRCQAGSVTNSPALPPEALHGAHLRRHVPRHHALLSLSIMIRSFLSPSPSFVLVRPARTVCPLYPAPATGLPQGKMATSALFTLLLLQACRRGSAALQVVGAQRGSVLNF